jgi:hypothetical protein
MMAELQTSQRTEFTEYRRNWKGHIDMVSSNRTLKNLLKYQPKGKRSLGNL